MCKPIEGLTQNEIDVVNCVCESVFQSAEETDLEDRCSLSTGFDMFIENWRECFDEELEDIHEGLSKMVRRLTDWRNPEDSGPYASLISLVMNANWMVRQASHDVVFKEGQYFIPDSVR